MAKQLDLFNASRTTEYRNTHPSTPRRLQTTGSGNRKIQRMVNHVSGRQSLRANRNGLMNGIKNAIMSRMSSTLRIGGIKKLRKGSFGSKGG